MQFCEAAVGYSLAVVDDDDAAAHCLDFLHDVGGKEHNLAFAGIAYHFAYLPKEKAAAGRGRPALRIGGKCPAGFWADRVVRPYELAGIAPWVFWWDT